MKFMEFLEKINPFSKEEDQEKTTSDDNTENNPQSTGVSLATTEGNPLEVLEGVEKIKHEIERMEFRKKSVLSVFRHEIEQLEVEKTNCLQIIGQHTYESYKNQSGEILCQGQLDTVRELEEQIHQKNQQIDTFAVRYDEEIKMLEASMSLQKKEPEMLLLPKTASKPLVVCPHCHEMVEKNRFCFSCGGALGTEPTESEKTEAVPKEPEVTPETTGKVEEKNQEKVPEKSEEVPSGAKIVLEKTEPTSGGLKASFGIQVEKPPEVPKTLHKVVEETQENEKANENVFLNFNKSTLGVTEETKSGLSPPKAES